MHKMKRDSIKFTKYNNKNSEQSYNSSETNILKSNIILVIGFDHLQLLHIIPSYLYYTLDVKKEQHEHLRRAAAADKSLIKLMQTRLVNLINKRPAESN